MKPYRLDDNYEIRHDGTCYILAEWRPPGGRGKAGKVSTEGRWKDCGYFGSISALLRSYVDRNVGRSTQTLPEALTLSLTNAQRAI